MLNNAWPSMIWHLYDWYLRPGGSYYGVKHACEPLHVQYSYDDRSVVVVEFVLPGVSEPQGDSQSVQSGHDREVRQGGHAQAAGEDSSTRVYSLCRTWKA
jgi:exo-1,4-beta-D-glucosaminidase